MESDDRIRNDGHTALQCNRGVWQCTGIECHGAGGGQGKGGSGIYRSAELNRFRCGYGEGTAAQEAARGGLHKCWKGLTGSDRENSLSAGSIECMSAVYRD